MVALRSRLDKLEQTYDTSDRDAAAARIRRMCAAYPALVPHTERIVRALLSGSPVYHVAVPEGADDTPALRELYMITWWTRGKAWSARGKGGPIVVRHYAVQHIDLRDERPARAPAPPSRWPHEPAPKPEPPAAPAPVSAYERLMADVAHEQQNGASDDADAD